MTMIITIVQKMRYMKGTKANETMDVIISTKFQSICQIMTIKILPPVLLKRKVNQIVPKNKLIANNRIAMGVILYR